LQEKKYAKRRRKRRRRRRERRIHCGVDWKKD
jgi:hypothetical protein